MEPDFVTRQHTESLVSSSDPSIAEVLNNYKFPPETPQPQMPSPMAGYNPQFGSSNNEMLLGTMLGQMQANMQNKNQPAQSPGFQLNINTEVLRWLIVLLLVATLIWIIFRVSRKEKSPLRRRLRKLERNYRKLYKARRKNPKALLDSDNDTSDFLDDDLDDLDDFDDDLDY